MTAKQSAMIESPRAASLVTRASVRPSSNGIPEMESRTKSLSEGTVYSKLDGYQVALISPQTPSPAGPSNRAQNAASPNLLVLPLTWDDLVEHIRPQSAPRHPVIDREIAQFGDVWIDFLRYEARRADQPVQLTAIEFKILKFFVANAYRVISRVELLDKVWGYESYPTTRTVDNRILSLRQKLERAPAEPAHFQTVHGVGYKFVPR